MEQMMDRVLRGIVEAWNARDADKVASFYTEDAIYEPGPAGMVLKGREAIKAYAVGICAGTPDYKLEIRNAFFSGTSGAAEFVMNGTPQGTLPLSGLQATGKSYTIKVCGIAEFRGELVNRNTLYWDMVSLLTQLGLMPSAS